MNKKPSERIKEISLEIELRWPNDPRPELNAIIQYLDEEWEQNKMCAHKSAYQVDSSNGDEVYYNVCNDCGVSDAKIEK